MRMNNLQRLWRIEYEERRGIHLEYTDEIPSSVVLFREFLEKSAPESDGGRILDIGCGRGRVGIHLARLGHEVIGFDFVPSVLDDFAQTAEECGVTDRISLFQQDMCDPWNVPDQSVDHVFAITVLENLIRKNECEFFRAEIMRVLKPCGLLVLEYYNDQDGYYGSLPDRPSKKDDRVLIDPTNGIPFRIHELGEIRALFQNGFRECMANEVSSQSLKYGLIYERKSQIVLFEKTGMHEL